MSKNGDLARESTKSRDIFLGDLNLAAILDNLQARGSWSVLFGRRETYWFGTYGFLDMLTMTFHTQSFLR